MRHHIIKSWPVFFSHVRDGSKTFEIRLNDRDYQVGDLVTLQEYDPNTKKLSGEEVEVVITYVFDPPKSSPLAMALLEDWCVFSFRVLDTPQGAPV